MKLTDEEVTAYLHRAEVGNPDAAKWASERIAEHITRLTAEGKELVNCAEGWRLTAERMELRYKIANEEHGKCAVELAEARRRLELAVITLKRIESETYPEDGAVFRRVHAIALEGLEAASLPAKPSGGRAVTKCPVAWMYTPPFRWHSGTGPSFQYVTWWNQAYVRVGSTPCLERDGRIEFFEPKPEGQGEGR